MRRFFWLLRALARSPQSWSSYSGYIRQVSQLCHAFRRSHDIDTARSLYRNATLEKIALLQAINQRETAFAESSVVALGIMDRMANILTDLQSTSSNISGVRMKMAKIVERNLGELFDRYKRDAHDTQSKLMGQAADQQAELIQNHSEAYLTNILFKQSQVAVASMNVVQTEMADLGQDLALSTATKMSSEETEMQRQASIDHRHALQSSIQSLTFLASTMMSLSALTEEKMSSINQTAREVQRALASPTGLLFWTLGIRDTSWAQIGRIVEGVSMVQVFHIAKYLPYLAAVARIAIYLIVCLYGIVGSIAFGIHKVASYVWSFATRHGQRRLELSHAATPTIPVVRSSSTLCV
ncbi:hypothetical protein FRB98_002024 [Tulasnella sp. 332]|nr:hypothetical protein FRB98_002024 [Tulasnella sp. 332]